MSRRILRVATRKSQLALTQTRAFIRELQQLFPEQIIEELHVTTTGDRVQDRSLADMGGKGLFVKEIEEALLAGDADIAVHSMKDLPADVAPGLLIASVPQRQDPRDVFVSSKVHQLEGLPTGARIGTSSLRRALQLKAWRNDLEIVPLRGNVDTRLRRAEDGSLDAVILACAGLNRLGWADRITQILPTEIMLPAAGQGALAFECRAADGPVIALLQRLHHGPTALAVAAERGVMRATGGNCHVPLAAFAELSESRFGLRGFLADPGGERAERAAVSAPPPKTENDAARIGEQLGRQLKAVLDCPHADS